MPHGRLQWTVVITVAALNVLLLFWVLVLADEQEADSAATRPSAADTSQDTAPEPSPTETTPTEPEPAPPTPPEGALQVGDTFEGEQSSTTLLQTRTLRPPAELDDQSGQAWFGIRVETCMNADAPPSGRLSLRGWVAKDGEGGRYLGVESPWEDFPPQQFPTSPIGPGACSLGWVLIPVPPGATRRIETVAFRPIAAVWAL